MPPEYMLEPLFCKQSNPGLFSHDTQYCIDKAVRMWMLAGLCPQKMVLGKALSFAAAGCKIYKIVPLSLCTCRRVKITKKLSRCFFYGILRVLSFVKKTYYVCNYREFPDIIMFNRLNGDSMNMKAPSERSKKLQKIQTCHLDSLIPVN